MEKAEAREVEKVKRGPMPPSGTAVLGGKGEQEARLRASVKPKIQAVQPVLAGGNGGRRERKWFAAK